MGWVKSQIIGFLLQEEGGKKKIRKINALILLVPVLMGAAVVGFMPEKENTSFVEQTSRHLVEEAQSKANGKSDATKGEEDRMRLSGGTAIADAQGKVNGVWGFTDGNGVSANGMSHPRGGSSGGSQHRAEIKYHAPQVIKRGDADPDQRLPIGVSFIGRLITAIDTRDPGALVRVIAPYGASFNHERKIEKNSVLFGVASYPGSGEKAYIKFNRVLFPDGREFKIDAQALSPHDYSPGIIGEEHDGAGGRIAGTVGLTMLSGISDTLIEKEVLGENAYPTPKSNLRNGFYQGAAKAAQNEAERRIGKMNNQGDYLTVPAGQDVIISLTETYKGEPQ